MSGMRGSWSLSRSLRLHVLVSATLPLLIAVVVGYSFLAGSVARELDALVDEELSEATLRLPEGWEPGLHFKKIADRCQFEHPEFPMAWRVLQTESGQVLGEFGVPRLFERSGTLRTPSADVVRLGSSMVAKTVAVDRGRSLALLIDGSVLNGGIQTYVLTSALTLSFCFVLALVAGGVTAGRIRRLFRKVASRVAVQAPLDGGVASGTDADDDRLPEEIREVAGQLQVVLQQVRSASEEARVFTMSLAHELRSPVQNLIGQSEVALMRPRDAAAYKLTLTQHLGELIHFSDALDNLLTYCAQPHARIERHEQFDLWEEAQIRLRREQQRGERKQVTVTLSCHGDTRMRGDREAVMRGVRNVVANAVDWTPAGSAVDVKIFGDEAGVHVTVEDGGPGLPEALREKIFEPFFQGPSADSRRIGYGLGLAMTKKVVDAHDGKIAVEDGAAGGARFVIDMAREPHAG